MSLSTIVPVAMPAMMTAFVASLRTREKVSFVSSAVSPTMGTLKLSKVLPGANTSSPFVLMKSLPSTALPARVEPRTLTGRPLAGVSLMLKTITAVPALPSMRLLFATESAGSGSLSRIVPMACARVRIAPVTPERFTEKASSSSSSRSLNTRTATVLLVSPGRNFNEPLAEAKSFPVTALPEAVA